MEGFQRSHAEAGPQWGSLLFIPNIQPSPVPIAFDEYISWCPRAKFEFIEGKPLINLTLGTLNVLAMLLLTFDLEGAVKLLPPQAWIKGLRQQLEWEQHDAKRKSDYNSASHEFSLGSLETWPLTIDGQLEALVC